MLVTDMAKASPGNLYALKTGRQLKRLTVGTLPKKLRSAQRRGYDLRVMLEDELVRCEGRVTATQAAILDAAAGDESALAVCFWLFRNRIDDMSTDHVLQTLAAMSRFRASRNRSILALNLDRDKQADIITALYRPLPDLPQVDPTDNGSDPTNDSDTSMSQGEITTDNTLSLHKASNGQA
jgi:hypothetical protein